MRCDRSTGSSGDIAGDPVEPGCGCCDASRVVERQAAGEPDCVVRVNDQAGGLVLYRPGAAEAEVLYAGKV